MFRTAFEPAIELPVTKPVRHSADQRAGNSNKSDQDHDLHVHARGEQNAAGKPRSEQGQ